MAQYFLDSYALIELLESNPRYAKYVDTEFVMTKLNAIELHFYMLKTFGEKDAEITLRKALKSVVEFDEEIIAEANKFRLRHKPKTFSTADCIGYVYALKNGLPFVTGDREFEGLPNVEFVKK